jgi:hypothetical protein
MTTVRAHIRNASHTAALGRNPLQADLLGGLNNFAPAIFGDTFEPEVDGERLTSQQKRVDALMADGQWRTLPKIIADLRKLYPGTHYGEASISARLRDMRRVGWKIERVRSNPTSGLYLYRAVKVMEAEAA